MGKSVSDLAVFGGQPAFKQPLHVGRPNVGDRNAFLERVNDALDRRWLSNHGPFLLEFEKRVATLHDVRHCIATSSGSVALELVVRALGLEGEVIVPAFTFVATAHTLLWHGIKPIFCDVDPRTHTLAPHCVEALVGPQTSAILGVHLWGRACDVEALSRIAERHGIALIFDAAHAFSCSYQGRRIGGGGNAEVLSFHATKVLNTFEGGAVLTNDDDLAARLRLLGNFGFADYDHVVSLGINAKMSEIAAAMGLTLLDDLGELVATNLRNYRRYQRMLGQKPGLRLLEYDLREHNNYHYVVLELDEERFGLSRDELMAVLWYENVLARRYFFPGCHRMEPYRSQSEDRPAQLPVTEQLASRVLCLPTGTAVRLEDIDTVCAIIRLAARYSSEIKLLLRANGQVLPGAQHKSGARRV